MTAIGNISREKDSGVEIKAGMFLDDSFRVKIFGGYIGRR